MNTYVKIVHGKKLATGKTNNCDTFVTETAPTSCGNILQWSSNEERRSGLLATLFILRSLFPYPFPQDACYHSINKVFE